MRNLRANLWLGTAALLAFAPGCERWINGMVSSSLVPFTQVSGHEPITTDVSRLVIRNGIGDVTVKADAAEEVRIEAEVKIKEGRALEADRGTFADHVTVTVSGDTMTIVDAHQGQPDKDDWSVTLVVHAPGRLAVEVDNGVGAVEVEGTESDVKLTTGVGEVTVRAPAAGRVIGTTGVGDVDIRLETVTGTVKADTGTGGVTLAVTAKPICKEVKLTAGVGDVRLKIPPESAGTFACVAGVGSVVVRNHEGLKATQSGVGAKAKGTVGQGGPNYTLETGVGSVTVE